MFRHVGAEPTALQDGATVAVIGGGPAGAFFAIHLLRGARELGRGVRVLILEQKREVQFGQPVSAGTGWEGCNYCAGGISPRLADALQSDGLALPSAIVEGRATQITVHGDWKSIDLTIPESREMLSVFRGSRPGDRPDRFSNLDSYLLNQAMQQGAEIITAEARDLSLTPDGRPLIHYRARVNHKEEDGVLEADLVVVAVGVNPTPGVEAGASRLVASLASVLPGFRPPRVRRALIVEVEGEPGAFGAMQGEMHFVPYGSRDLEVELSSLIPKGQWMTVVLLGKGIDRGSGRECLKIAAQFLELPHIKRALPRGRRPRTVCLCRPNMTVGVARRGVGDRIALVGDAAVSRLYKDGLYSAHMTASALARGVLERGVDRRSLEASYWPVVDSIGHDNRYGRFVFALTRVVFSRPVLSRVLYQALLTERKTVPARDRRLANVLWRTSSGDDTYRRILAAMFHPVSAWRVLFGGAVVTVRNYVTEMVFGLRWADLGRYPTGVPMEDVPEKRAEVMRELGITPSERPPVVERMYSIRIRASGSAILAALGKFGDQDREFFTPRMIRVRRSAGEANEIGSRIRYEVTPRWYSFSVSLEKAVDGQYLLYRALDGFPADGILAFDVMHDARGSVLTIYVAFDFPRPRNPLKRAAWWLLGFTFPGFVHDVVWNHALCKLKEIVETADEQAA